MMSVKNYKILELEAKACFNFFWDGKNTNTNKESKGYGLVIDRTNRKDHSSMASVGFALSSYVIGVERGWITYDEGLERVVGTLRTVVKNVPHYKGFLSHFVLMETAERHRKSEYSTIDTSLVLNGALTVDSYFNNEEVHTLVKELVERVDWNFLVFEFKGKTTFRMAYNPDRDGAYANGNAGYIYQWDMPAEQLMMYFLAAGHNEVNEKTAWNLYNGFNRYSGGYKQYQFIYTPGGALFTYQFSHAWFDFSQYVDAHGFDWYMNTRNATLANRLYCIDLKDKFKTFNENSWGLTACDHPKGYAAFGPEPLGWDNIELRQLGTNGTVAPNGPAGSVPYAPVECIDALEYMYNTHPKLWGEYGFKDSYNLEHEPWYCDVYLGLDKGITLLAIDNYLHGTTWKYYMMHPVIQKAIKVLHFKERNF
ncbi:MAG: hypothetical protein K0Q49_1043 [Haloplasmataceae bacterium]|jgi:hypothetical protein|nr:hypothetical protein [Haloplasmataceae bacterium]